ncbi:MAG: hypothetical protein DRN08_00275 [Thermoplasmata archaeon]|nr:MAG: hypothetical protein DRN08_00275 [Thermoplasmata archaeon]
MRLRMAQHKATVIGIIILLLYINLSTIGSSQTTPFIDKEDGVWIDTFENTKGLQEMRHCNVSNGQIILETGHVNRTYDFNQTPSDHKAFDAALFAPYGIPIFPKFLRKILFEQEIDYEGIKKQYDGKVTQSKTPSYMYKTIFTVVQHFRFKLDEKADQIEGIDFYWRGYTDNVSKIKLYMFRFSKLQRWIEEEDYDATGTSQHPQTISYSLDGNVEEYIGSRDNCIDFALLVIPEEPLESCSLYTDYVKIRIRGGTTYLSDAYAVSVPIGPYSNTTLIPQSIKLARWENIFWEGSKATNVSSVRIQVLDSSSLKPVNDSILPGNSDGFTYSPIDISSLPTNTYYSIVLKAIFHTNDLSISPRLYSWAVTWQVEKNRFQDNFSSVLRIDEGVGINIAHNRINMSDFYSDWPFFGKTLDNNRVYEGFGPKKYDIGWYTYDGVGGKFCSPVLSHGRIFIASSKYKRIYAFDLDIPSGRVINEPIDESKLLKYSVEMSPAIIDDFVIVATGELDRSNIIYALDKNNLSHEFWNKTFAGSICFSAPPTVSHGKIFITSWNSKGWNTPLFYLKKLSNPLFYLIPSISSLRGGNNKIFALDVSNGDILWEADLPAGSLSTPAVSDNMVFVGCENIGGNSLFAFDEDTGSKIWNISIGAVGRSSPVVYDGKVFVLAKKFNQSSFSWKPQIFVIDQYNGEILWNKTIGKKDFMIENLPKIFVFNISQFLTYSMISASTPVVHDGIVFTVSSDGMVYALDAESGDEKWVFNATSTTFFGLVPTIMVSSPVVADGVVYVVAGDGTVYAINESSGTEIWHGDAARTADDWNAALSSPIIADGLLYVSTINNDGENRLFAIGSHTDNTKARVISIPVHLPKHHWWDKFHVEYDNSTGGNIKFSILNEEYNTLMYDINISSGDISNSTLVNNNVIRLCAEFFRENRSQNPILNRWYVTWTEEDSPPTFDINSFIPGGRWINSNTPLCSINVSDSVSGLNINSAEYYIRYVSNGTLTTYGPVNINTSLSNGVHEATLIANISDLSISQEISDIKSINFTIKDLAGNRVYTGFITFNKDLIKPSSHVLLEDSNISSYNSQPIEIRATAMDNLSGLISLSLYYRYSENNDFSGSWILFNKTNVDGSPKENITMNWSFNGNRSGYYELCSIATDLAGNTEDFPEQGDISFLLDTTSPYEPDFDENRIYWFNSTPMFSGENTIVFSDDFLLYKIEYRLNFEVEWTEIASDVNENSYNATWSIHQEHWDEMVEGEEYYLYFRLTDYSGNHIDTYQEDRPLRIKKDVSPPETYLDISDITPGWHWDNSFIINASAYDRNGSGIKKMELYYRYSSDNIRWENWTRYGDEIGSSPFEWRFTAKNGNGYYQFRLVAEDAAGNIGESPVFSAGINIFPLTLIITMIASLGILFVTTIVLYMGWRKSR